MQKDLVPVHFGREHLHVQPALVVLLEVLAQLHALTEHAEDAVVDGEEVRVGPVGPVTPVVEAVHTRTESTLFGLEVPWPRVHVCK